MSVPRHAGVRGNVHSSTHYSLVLVHILLTINQVLLAQAVVYMARAPKSVEVYCAYERAKQCVQEHKGPLPSVPLHLRNAPTRLMKGLGYGRGYKYNPNFMGEVVEQDYMPEGMQKLSFFQ